jgi:hypothetical protein
MNLLSKQKIMVVFLLETPVVLQIQVLTLHLLLQKVMSITYLNFSRYQKKNYKNNI